MIEQDPKIVTSRLSRIVKQDGVTVPIPRKPPGCNGIMPPWIPE